MNKIFYLTWESYSNQCKKMFVVFCLLRRALNTSQLAPCFGCVMIFSSCDWCFVLCMNCRSFFFPQIYVRNFFQAFSAYVNQLMVNWWLGLVVWIPGSPVDRKGLGVLKGTPIRGPQSTGPQTTNLSLVDLVVDYRG